MTLSESVARTVFSKASVILQPLGLNTLQIIVITRFNYRLKESDPIEPLIEPNNWNARLKLFKQFCLPSMLGQADPNFHWILIIDAQLPDVYQKELARLTNPYARIHLAPWNYNDKMYQLSWIESIIPLNSKYLVTVRLDSDDALAKNYIRNLRQLVLRTTIPDFLFISFSTGCTCSLPNFIYRPIQAPMIALGLALIVDRTKYPMTVYCGNHTKIIKYLKDPTLSPIFAEYNFSIGKHLQIVRTTEPVFIRTIHDHNLQQNLVRHNRISRNMPIDQHFCLEIEADLSKKDAKKTP